MSITIGAIHAACYGSIRSFTKRGVWQRTRAQTDDLQISVLLQTHLSSSCNFHNCVISVIVYSNTSGVVHQNTRQTAHRRCQHNPIHCSPWTRYANFRFFRLIIILIYVSLVSRYKLWVQSRGVACWIVIRSWISIIFSETLRIRSYTVARSCKTNERYGKVRKSR